MFQAVILLGQLRDLIIQRLVPEIGVVQLGVVAALRQKPVVRALFDNPALVHDDDAVGVFDGGQAVGAMTMAVRSRMMASRPSWICASVKGSTLAVASPRIKTDGSSPFSFLQVAIISVRERAQASPILEHQG
jgi:hypothetical protein